MYSIYILKSVKQERYYIGATGDLLKRLKAHNSGKVRSTKAFKPWKIIYSEDFNNKSEALKRERQIKSFKSGEAFKNLISERWQSG